MFSRIVMSRRKTVGLAVGGDQAHTEIDGAVGRQTLGCDVVSAIVTSPACAGSAPNSR